MVERQPGRPDEYEFIGAALRYTAGEYTAQLVHVQCGPFVNVFKHFPGIASDMDIIRRESEAVGRSGVPETLEDFALRQLSSYRRRQNG